MIPNSEKKNLTVRISKKDLLKILSENESLKEQITVLNAKLDAALDLAAEYKESLNELNKVIDDQENALPSHDIYNPNIYFDGSNGLP